MTNKPEHFNILIVGGTGSLGSELTRFYYEKGWTVTVFSRDGHKQQTLGMKYPNVNFVLGDICDTDAIRFALEGQHYVVNAAALKIVDQGEVFVDEFIRVNILGAQNIARQCYDMGIYNVLQISSDKACEPLNLYGKTKAITEDIFRSFGFASLRYGNVVNSRGSFYNIWKQQILDKQKISIRYPYPTRFILTIDDAIDLVDDALRSNSHCGDLFAPRSLMAFNVNDVATAMGITEWTTSPLHLGEKAHEKLLADSEHGVPVSDLLVLVKKNQILDETEKEVDRLEYCSATAPKITGEEFLKKVGYYEE